MDRDTPWMGKFLSETQDDLIDFYTTTRLGYYDVTARLILLIICLVILLLYTICCMIFVICYLLFLLFVICYFSFAFCFCYQFLAAIAALQVTMSVCRSVGLSVGRSVCRSVGRPQRVLQKCYAVVSVFMLFLLLQLRLLQHSVVIFCIFFSCDSSSIGHNVSLSVCNEFYGSVMLLLVYDSSYCSCSI